MTVARGFFAELIRRGKDKLARPVLWPVEEAVKGKSGVVAPGIIDEVKNEQTLFASVG